MYRRSMSAFQLVSLLPTYHLVNGQTSGRAKWAHGRRPDLILVGYRGSRMIHAQPAGWSKSPDFSPAQPRRAETRLVPINAAAPWLTLVLRFTLWERAEIEAGGLFQQPVSQAAQAAGKRRQYRNRFSHS